VSLVNSTADQGAESMKLNDRCHVIAKDGEPHNAWFIKYLTADYAIIELDNNTQDEITVPVAKIKRNHHSQG
jgi:hypothetical protein